MVAILGGGSGGIALAVYFQDRNVDVTVWNRTYSRIEKIIQEDNNVFVKDYKNKLEKNIRINKLTSDLEDTIRNNKIFFVVTPGKAHGQIARRIRKFIDEEKIIILIPGRTYGSITFNKQLGEKKGLVSCYETQTLLHASRVKGNILEIFGIKTKIIFTSLDDGKEQDISELNELFPEMEYTEDYYSVTLNNIGAMFHPVPSILNISRIENEESYNHYQQGISPSIAHYIEKMDAERKLICEELGAKFISASGWLKMEYNTLGDDLYENLKNNESYYHIKGPNSIDHRYIFDDIMTGLVPIYKTALKHDIKVEYMKSFLKFASLLIQYDFVKNGREGI